jgi:hypothetical protein
MFNNCIGRGDNNPHMNLRIMPNGKIGKRKISLKIAFSLLAVSSCLNSEYTSIVLLTVSKAPIEFST